ncbi:hypothetical protein OH686_23765 [Pseudomonas sp. SO81]|nr:hypothetical protein OH686_23765 [Pseudomonas sp. SO81]
MRPTEVRCAGVDRRCAWLHASLSLSGRTGRWQKSSAYNSRP